ncbi:ataxin-7-like protein 3 [Exaiptasia diaphana]|uniref:SAGA-associated factor 11 homolog n=1 Tax=Exaiptasia diaphana TaxID=2652724 RepID=A0A913XFZ0_EXADI|nr:ataxin-7-like protein 3 [Exaiptasia diaphana]KXJ12462.1 Ataxin-7-like protein 3 [Exaiptasia diaphana]
MTTYSMVIGNTTVGKDILDVRENSSPEAAITYEIIDDVILGLCFEMHKSIKLGTFGIEEVDEKTSKQYEVVDVEGLDVFGQVPLKKPMECICPNCQRNMAASRFAPHLEKCMGMGRNSSRIASRRSQRCPQHTDDQRKSVRLRLLGQENDPVTLRHRPDGTSFEAEDVIDVDSYEDGDGPSLLRDTLSRLSWEEESNASTGDDNSPAAFGPASLVKKKRKKKAKHKKRSR